MASWQAEDAKLHIDQDESGSRLDRVLLRRIGSDHRPLIMRLIRKGNVRVNGKRAKPEQRLQCGDVVFIPMSLRGEPGKSVVADENSQVTWRRGLTLPVLYEDEDILVINKPAGVVVHGGSGHQSGIIEYLKQERAMTDLRLVHRLDRDTSGCLLLAKRLPALRGLAQAFRERTAHKTYLAWVKGHPYPYASRLQSRLAKGVLRGGERMVVDMEHGKHAVTDYQAVLLASHAGWPYALLALQPESGRTHQLRVQLQMEGHAILGDAKYADREDRQQFRAFGGKGLALHAWRLRFIHPGTGRHMEFKAPWPAWWSECFAGPERLVPSVELE